MRRGQRGRTLPSLAGMCMTKAWRGCNGVLVQCRKVMVVPCGGCIGEAGHLSERSIMLIMITFQISASR